MSADKNCPVCGKPCLAVWTETDYVEAAGGRDGDPAARHAWEEAHRGEHVQGEVEGRCYYIGGNWP